MINQSESDWLHIDIMDGVFVPNISYGQAITKRMGFGGQKFIYRTINKIQKLRAMIDERNLNVDIEIDGGVGLQNAEAILKAGA
eukprot:maker-scaffold165_size294773-snap-gene-1.0 protein:Tk00471 transcript:maker-scaffold165_size294773-snap-gene-1.0-mRNA-1 annotation:"ribulose-phosphate 3-epimerase"